MELVNSGRLKPNFRGSDQELLFRVNYDSIRKGAPHTVVADDQMMLFQVVTFSYKDLILQTLAETVSDANEPQHRLLQNLIAEDSDWGNRSMVYNHISHTIPSLLHFPGPKKPKNWWKLMWWMQPQANHNTASGRAKLGETPAAIFYKSLEEHTDESSGYGARLPDGSWRSYMDLCGAFKSIMLK